MGVTKFVVPTLVVIVSLALLLDSQSGGTNGGDPLRLAGSSASPANLAIFAAGRVEGATMEISLRPELRGVVMALPFDEGQTVAAGDILLRLNDEQYVCQLALAQAELARATAEKDRLQNGARAEERREAEALYRAKLAELQLADANWQRSDDLRAHGAIAQEQAENDESLAKSLRAQVLAAESRWQVLQAPAREDELQIKQAQIEAAAARVALADVELARTRLHAPTDGQILKVNLRLGELTGPDAAEPALIIADTSKFMVRAFVEELDAPRISLGMSATITADGLIGKSYRGKVVRVSPRMTRKELWSDDPTERFDTKIREVLIELIDASELVVGLRVDVEIDSATVGLSIGSKSVTLRNRSEGG
jgi:multidrug resistance efflux pump